MNVKTLLTCGLLASATVVSAQSFEKKAFSAADLNQQVKALPTLMDKSHAPLRAYADKVYYHTPKGTLFRGIDSQGRGYSYTMLVVPPYKELVYENKSADPAQTTWTVNGNDASELVKDNNFVTMYGVQGLYYAPTVNSGAVSWTLGDYNDKHVYVLTDSVSYLSYFDDNAGSTYGFGIFDNKYITGTGNFTIGGKTYKSSGVTQIMDAPAAPLWISDFAILAYTDSVALFDDGKITLTVYPAQGRNIDYANPLGTFTATTADTTFLYSGASSLTKTGKFSIYGLRFSNKVLDEESGLTFEEPIVVNSSVAFVINGCDKPGVNVSFPLHFYEDRDEKPTEERPQAYRAFFNAGDTCTYLGFSNSALKLNFKGMFDYVETEASVKVNDATVEGVNVLRVSADGKTVTTDGKTGNENFGGAVVYTAIPFNDGDGNPNYFAELPEWVVSMTGSDEGRVDAQGSTTGLALVSFECEPLPEGVSGRAASIYLEGKGYKSATPIILLQGDATLADGIESLRSTEKTRRVGVYNLAGQRVNDNAKGLLIKNGKKVLQ